MKDGDSGLLSCNSLGYTKRGLNTHYRVALCFNTTHCHRKTGLVLYPDSVRQANGLGDFGPDPSLLQTSGSYSKVRIIPVPENFCKIEHLTHKCSINTY